MKKSIISLVLVCLIAASFTACSSEGTAETKTKDTEKVEETTTVETTEASVEVVEETTEEITEETSEETTELSGCYACYGDVYIPDLNDIYPIDNAEYVLEQFNNNISCRVTVSEELFNSVEIGLEGSTSVTSAQAKADEKMAILTDYDFQPTTFAGQDVLLYENAVSDTNSIITVYFEKDSWICYIKVNYCTYDDTSRTKAEEFTKAIIDNMVIDEEAAKAHFGI